MNNYFASCPRGMEAALSKELNAAGCRALVPYRGGVDFEAEDQALYSIILGTRLASRIFIRLTEKHVHDAKDLYKKFLDFNWTEVFDVEQSFKITTLFDLVTKEAFGNAMYVSQNLKDAVVDVFRDKYNVRPDVDKEDADVSIYLRLEEGDRRGYRAQILLDLVGAPLSRRGYRRSVGEAPLKENLAAAIVGATDWNKTEPFIDGMCGSGTLLIEAIMSSAAVCPQFMRVNEYLEGRSLAYDFLDHAWFTSHASREESFNKFAQSEVDRSRKALKEIPSNTFYGYDIDDRMVEVTRTTLERLGIPDGRVHLECIDAAKLIAPAASGVLVCNPPYGERMGEVDELRGLYHDLGENFKANFKGWRTFVFTGNLELRKSISLQTSARIPFQNGKIECRLLRYEMF